MDRRRRKARGRDYTMEEQKKPKRRLPVDSAGHMRQEMPSGGAGHTRQEMPSGGAQRIRREPEHISDRRRRREEETEAKMRLLWGILGILVVILIAAIIYEFVLGYGMKETGAQRMGELEQETALLGGQTGQMGVYSCGELTDFEIGKGSFIAIIGGTLMM